MAIYQDRIAGYSVTVEIDGDISQCWVKYQGDWQPQNQRYQNFSSSLDDLINLDFLESASGETHNVSQEDIDRIERWAKGMGY